MKNGKGFEYRAGTARARFSGGQTVLELALMMPLMLLLLVGLIEIGRFAYFDILVSNAARAGAQYGAQSLIQAADQAGIQTAAKSDGLNTMTITPTQMCGCAAGTLGGCPSGGVCAQPLVYVQVTATETFSSLFRYPGIPTSMTLTSTSTMRVSR
jgi:Flp pilus assembly protein TadG